MLTWEELERAAPEIAAHGRELIEKFQFVLVGTLTKDGSPRRTARGSGITSITYGKSSGASRSRKRSMRPRRR